MMGGATDIFRGMRGGGVFDGVWLCTTTEVIDLFAGDEKTDHEGNERLMVQCTVG